MVQTLAIRGHYYSGDKVIALLAGLGGNNTKGYDGSKIDYFYYINSKGEIDCILQDNMLITQWETHSLDSFNKEYPYKTFDKFVLYGKEASICETFWNGFTIKYKIYNGLYWEYSAEQLKSAINENKEESTKEKTDCEEKTTTTSPLEIYGNIYEGLEYLEKMGYSLDNMTCADLKKLLYKKIVG